MAENNILILSVLSIVVIIVFQKTIRLCLRSSTSSDHRDRHTTAQAICALLDPPKVPLIYLLHSRALPNQRLKQALGLSSTFVSNKVSIHTEFTREAKGLINGTSPGRNPLGWLHWVDTAGFCSKRFLLGGDSIDFANYMQSITMSIVVVGLLGGDITSLDPAEVSFVTKTINERWAQSKIESTFPRKSLDEINALIFRWIPDREKHPYPLNFIIPAYETMWRVVAVAFVYANRSDTLRQVFLDFAENPTMDRFQAYEGGNPSVEAVILEVLRLHPPTRHIARTTAKFSFAGVPSFMVDLLLRITSRVEIADVETVQRSSAWGGDAFDPMNHHPSRDPPSLFAFGFGKLKCVASNWAPLAAAIVVAQVMRRVEKEGYVLKEGGKIGGREGWNGWCVHRGRMTSGEQLASRATAI